ncbi:MAG: protein arginine kinase [Victivallales bacterium]|nr:protein arginine kinase [Victivallales bacterium]
MNSDIKTLLNNKVSWLADCGPSEDIAISSRIRLARNIDGIPFPLHASATQLQEIITAVEMALKGSKLEPFLKFNMAATPLLDKMVMFERRLISREFMDKTEPCELLLQADESFGIMVNEEDHLRMQFLRPGFQLKNVWTEIDRIDDIISRHIPYAFDKELGFLTSCPTNVGTGIRASVMLHLPGLVLSNQINAVIQGVSKLGLVVRGIFGEGTKNLGNLYQVSNQSTLGESEMQIIERLNNVIVQIINHEKNARRTLLEGNQAFLLNHVGRAYGMLRHAYILSSSEALDSLSALRLGVDMGMFSAVDIHTVNELFIVINPAHLQKYAGKELDSPSERDVFRATMVRERLKVSDRGK